MPPPKAEKVDPGRGFDSYGAIMWTQRVEKEERALLRDDRPRRRPGDDGHQRSRRSSRQSSYPASDYSSVLSQATRASEDRLSRLERDHHCGSRPGPAKHDDSLSRPERRYVPESDRGSHRSLSQASSAPNLMYSTDQLPPNLRALQRFGIAEANLITMRGRKPDEMGYVPRLRMKAVEVDAHWVPGTGKLIEYRPECYLEKEEAGARRRPSAGPEAAQKIWTLPPAGKSFKDAVAFGEAPAAALPAKLATAQGAAAGQPPGVAGHGAAVAQPAASVAGSSASHALSVSFAPGSTAMGRTHEGVSKPLVSAGRYAFVQA